MRKKNIIYIGDNLGRNGSVMQIHAKNISKIFKELGYSIVYVSLDGWVPGMNEEVFNTLDGEEFHCYYSLARPIPNDTIRRWYRRYLSLSGEKHFRAIRRLISIYNPEFMVCYGYISVKQLVKYSRKTGLPLIIDQTDWFSATHYSDFYNKYIWSRHVNKSVAYWSMRAYGVIAISDFFYKFYKDKLPTIQIPALANELKNTNYANERQSDDLLKIVYTGTPGNKDLLQPVIDAVIDINSEKQRIIFDIVGISKYGCLFGKEAEKKGIVFHGRVSHEKALEFVLQADCTVLLRRNERYAKAGFSTKFSESMILGVPVICTAIGGTDRCIIDNENGFLVGDNEVDTVRKKLEEIINIKSEILDSIKRNSKEYARKHFYYMTYVERMREFLKTLQR